MGSLGVDEVAVGAEHCSVVLRGELAVAVSSSGAQEAAASLGLLRQSQLSLLLCLCPSSAALLSHSPQTPSIRAVVRVPHRAQEL